MRAAVPKAFVTLAAGHEPSRDTAYDILRHARHHLAPYKRVRLLEFVGADPGLPKTISGKIRRVELRTAEADRVGGDAGGNGDGAFSETDFPELAEG